MQSKRNEVKGHQEMNGKALDVEEALLEKLL
jgi:hypothetical protein